MKRVFSLFLKYYLSILSVILIFLEKATSEKKNPELKESGDQNKEEGETKSHLDGDEPKKSDASNSKTSDDTNTPKRTLRRSTREVCLCMCMSCYYICYFFKISYRLYCISHICDAFFWDEACYFINV